MSYLPRFLISAFVELTSRGLPSKGVGIDDQIHNPPHIGDEGVQLRVLGYDSVSSLVDVYLEKNAPAGFGRRGR